MTRYWQSFVYAMLMLTRIPMPRLMHISPQVQQRALLFYPAVGLILGGLLAGLAALLLWHRPLLSPLVIASIVLTAWVLLTGALHLDGLADSCDAWLGGFGDRQRTLEIMKDPQAGPAAVVAVVLVLLLKVSALVALIETPSLNLWAVLLAVPVVARLALWALVASLPYAREQGMASGLSKGFSALQLLLWATPWVVFAAVLLQRQAILGLLFAGVMILWLRHLMQQRLGGYTGDTLGASVEALEAGLLIAIVVG